jgi:predicted secreted hydrolase
VVFGKDGVSRKGADPRAASHYLTFPRLTASGVLTLGTERVEVQGEAWMDHEISSSQLDPQQIGWDWACIQLRDGREAMVYRMRRMDGSTDSFSTLAWVDAAGAVQHTSDFALVSRGTWRSPHTGAEYPAALELQVPASSVRWRLEPLARDQEINGRITGLAYWEGACRVLDEQGAEIGSAFVELTGYSGDLRRSLR